jgi:hypothetical protein
VRALVVGLALLLPGICHAQALVTAVLDAPNVPDATVKKVQRATEVVLRQLSGLSVAEGPAFKRGAPKKCADDCAQQLVRALGSPGVLLLELRPLEGRGERLSVELQLWLDGVRLAVRRGEGSAEGFEAAVRPVLEGLLPGWARKGFGGLLVQVEPGALVKVDGRLALGKATEVQSVTAGVHLVDVVFADGHAVLQRVEVAEGGKVALEVNLAQDAFDVKSKRGQGTRPLRVVSYATWMAGAAALAGGLVAGALGRGTAAGLTPCTGQTRDCPTLDVVLERNRQAQAYASTGNVLLGVGAGLATVGAALFVVDAATE